MADNIDHNQIIIDGKGYLHAMGVVSAATSHNSIDLKELKSVQQEKRKKASEVICGMGIPISTSNRMD